MFRPMTLLLALALAACSTPMAPARQSDTIRAAGQSADREVASLHTITGGTGRYAGASGYIRLWNGEGELLEYEAVIHLADAVAEVR